MKKDDLHRDANPLLDTVIERLKLRNDAALSRALEVAPPVISKLRHGRLTVGPTLLIRMHEETGLSIRDLKGFLRRFEPGAKVVTRTN